jgi:hypothetical protein
MMHSKKLRKVEVDSTSKKGNNMSKIPMFVMMPQTDELESLAKHGFAPIPSMVSVDAAEHLSLNIISYGEHVEKNWQMPINQIVSITMWRNTREYGGQMAAHPF